MSANVLTVLERGDIIMLKPLPPHVGRCNIPSIPPEGSGLRNQSRAKVVLEVGMRFDISS